MMTSWNNSVPLRSLTPIAGHFAENVNESVMNALSTRIFYDIIYR